MRMTFEEKFSILLMSMMLACLIITTCFVICAAELCEIVTALGHIEGLLMRE